MESTGRGTLVLPLLRSSLRQVLIFGSKSHNLGDGRAPYIGTAFSKVDTTRITTSPTNQINTRPQMGSTVNPQTPELEAAAAQVAYFIRTTFVLYGIGVLAALIRIAIRYYLARSLRTEEYLVLFALLCWTADTACIPFIVNNGTNSMPAEKRLTITPGSLEWANRTMAGKMFVGAWVAYITMIWSLKASILVFYSRLTERLHEQRLIKVAWGVVGVTWVACILSMFLVWIVGVLNILTDLLLLAIPLPMVFRLRGSIGRKVMLGCLFGLGIFVIIATALRIYFTIEGGNIQNMTFWSMIETCTAIIVANAPGIRAIFVHFQANTAKKATGNGSRQQNTWGMNRPNPQQGPKNPFEALHTVNIEAGDSTERIFKSFGGFGGDPELGNTNGSNMAIHQHVTYEVRTCEATLE
ncbi:hypothetical protein EV426DRAFT_716387 [Tirmania nivea]|nr:hypothetical protein EV426DRAFT_716387 [Tirmania nivea]